MWWGHEGRSRQPGYLEQAGPQRRALCPSARELCASDSGRVKQLPLFQMTGTGDRLHSLPTAIWIPFVGKPWNRVSSYCTRAGFLSLVPNVLLIRTKSSAFVMEHRYCRTPGSQVSLNPQHLVWYSFLIHVSRVNEFFFLNLIERKSIK